MNRLRPLGRLTNSLLKPRLNRAALLSIHKHRLNMSTATNGVLEARQGDRPRYVDVHSPAQDFSIYSTADIIADHFFAVDRYKSY